MLKGRQLIYFLQGIVIGLDNLDAVIQIIRETSNHTAATRALVNGNILQFYYDMFFFSDLANTPSVPKSPVYKQIEFIKKSPSY